MRWDLAEQIDQEGTVENQVFQGLNRLEKLRKSEKVFVARADSWTVDTDDVSVLGMGRYYDGDKLIGLFNFSGEDKRIYVDQIDGAFTDMMDGSEVSEKEMVLPAYGFRYLKRTME